MTLTPFESFLAATDELRAACGSVEIAAVVMRRGDAWQVLSARVVLWPWRHDTTAQNVLRLDGLEVMTRICGEEILPSLLEGLRARRLHLPGWPHGESPQLSGSPDDHHDWLELRTERSRAIASCGVAWPVHTLVLQGTADYQDNSVRDAERSLVTADPPYLDWSDLHADLGFGASFRNFNNRGPWITVSAVVPARLAEVTTTTKEIQAVVEHLTAAGKSKLALVQRGASRAERRIVTLVPHGADTAAPQTVEFQFPPPSQRGLVDVVLSYNGWTCDRATTGVADGRAAVHALFDPGHGAMTSRMDPEKKQAVGFEEAVTWLLHDLGFAAARYGPKDLGGAPDVVAFADDDHVLVCECSVGLVEPEMVAKAKHRAEEVEACLRDLGRRPFVLAVAITAVEQRFDPEEAGSPRDQGVAVVTQSDLDAWRTRALLGEGPAPFWDFVVARATPVPQKLWGRRAASGFLPGLGG